MGSLFEFSVYVTDYKRIIHDGFAWFASLLLSLTKPPHLMGSLTLIPPPLTSRPMTLCGSPWSTQHFPPCHSGSFCARLYLEPHSPPPLYSP